jgi:DNA repair exonuclease SbcCD ATPase subunit
MKTILVRFLEKRSELHEVIKELSTRKTEAGKIFSQMNAMLEAHFRNEGVTIVPLVKLLEKRLVEGEENIEDSRKAMMAGRKYKQISETMYQEHREMERLCKIVQDILKREPDKKESYAVEQLISLIKLEDEFVYAMANYYGDTLKLNEFASSLDGFDFFVRVMP